MKTKITIILLSLSISVFSQSAIEKYNKAEILLRDNKNIEAHKILKELKNEVQQKDTLYNYLIWYYVGTSTELEKEHRMKEDFSSSLNFGLEALSLIQENKQFFDAKFAEKEAWMIKNIIVSYFGIGKTEEAKKYKDILYKRYNDKTLSNGIDEYFNYDFFKLEDKNIWGYEWFPELPENRYNSSFTKVVYYVYSTNPDGTDKEQLCRFHVLMFHQNSENTKFDYVLEKQVDTEEQTISGTYYQYTYKKEIDYLKLKENIKEIVTKSIEPSSRRIIPKRK